MEIFKIEKLENENNKDFIYRSLRESIIKATIKPGESISETKLKEHFNVSRSPIREALSILIHEGLIKVQPKKNTKVVLIDGEYILESRFLRCVVEKEILLKLCTSMDTSTLTKELFLIIDEAEKIFVSKKDSIKLISNYDTLFHSRIFEYAGYKHIWKLIRTSNIQYNRFLNLYIEEKLYGGNFIQDHKQLAKNIQDKKIDVLIEYTLENYRRIENYLKELIELHPDYFL